MVCIARPHSANIAMIVAGTPSQTRKHHVNQTRVQVSPRNPCGVECVFIIEVHRATCSCFDTSAMTGSVTKTHVDGFHHANHHLSKRASQSLVVWSSSQKLYNTNIAKIIIGTSSLTRTLNKCHLRINTSRQFTLKLDSARCVYLVTTQCNICKDSRSDGFEKKGASKTVRMSTETSWRVRSSKIIEIWCSSPDHGEPTLQCSSLGPARIVAPKV